MDYGHFPKNVFSLLTLCLFISKNFNTAQESTSHNEGTPTSNIRQRSIRSATFDSYPLTKNALLKKSFEENVSIFKDNLDKFAESLRTNYNYTWNELEQKTSFNQVSNLLHHSSLKLADHRTIVELKHRMEELENQLNNLKESSTQIDEGQKYFDIITMLNTFKPHMNEKLETLNKKARIALLEPLINECVVEIMAHRFDSAEKKLQKMNDNQRIEFVVKKAYDWREEHFYTLLNFASSYKNNPEDILVLYEALYNEMNYFGHENLSKLLLIINHLIPQISEHLKNRTDSEGRRNENESLKTRFESFLSILKNSTKTAAINEIADAFILNYLSKLTFNIIELDGTGFFDMNLITEAAIDRISRKLDTKHLSSIIRLNKGLCVNETTPTPLTSRLKTILSWSKYCTLSQDIKKLAQRAINSSPVEIGVTREKPCDKVCIMNVNYNEYLYDPDESECLDKYTNISCPAYTTSDQSIGKSDQLAWNLKRMGNNKIQIISYHHNYTLFVDDQKWDDERRSVSTRHINEVRDKFEWRFESDGDFVFIKNIHYQEYLTASVKGYINNVTTIDLRSMVTTSKRLRKVFTFTSKKLTPDCYWTIVECPQNS